MDSVSPKTAFRPEDQPKVLDDVVDLLSYRRDASVAPAGKPIAAFRASSVEDVQTALRLAAQKKLPVYCWGAGSTYAGGVNPTAGGIALDLSPMNRILEVNPDRGLVVVEPGVTYGALLAALKPHGLTVGIVPLTGPAGTVGGTVSSHGLGTGSPKFQSTGDEVAGLEVVLPDATLLRTGSAALGESGFFQRYAIGPDLTGLFLGANGTLGVITKIALWTHPLPPEQATMALGFPDYSAGARFIASAQARDALGSVWYGAGYEQGAVAARVGNIEPLPGFGLGLDLRGEKEEITHARDKLLRLAEEFGGFDFPAFDQAFFSKLRRDFTFWYGYAGYFSRSMCALLMTSMATTAMPRFFDLVAGLRERYPQFVWGSGTILCRRGLHGGVILFYDEASQWSEAQQVCAACCDELLRIGCVPYKSGKVWAPTMERFGAYYKTLQTVKAALDPSCRLGVGNLGLSRP